MLGPTTKHRWAYACSKLIDEFLALAYWKERKLPVIVVRLFNTVGPRQTGQYGMVIPNFVRQALAGQPITVFGDGTQSRSFTYVGDVVRAMVALIDEPRAVGQVFNIGNGAEITIADLAEQDQGADRQLVRRSSRIPYDQAYEAGFEDMPRRVPGYHARSARSSATSRRWSSTRSSTRVIEHVPPALRMSQSERTQDACTARRRARAAPAGEAGAPAAARDGPRSRRPILPEIVQIESTNICNAKCVFCPRDEMHRGRAS